MSKIKLLLNLASDMRTVADDLEAICRCMSQADTTTETSAASSPAQDENHDTSIPDTFSTSDVLAPNQRIDPDTGEIITLELTTLRSLAASKAQTREQKAQMKLLLQKHGVAKLTELPLNEYFAFQKEVEAIV